MENYLNAKTETKKMCVSYVYCTREIMEILDQANIVTIKMQIFSVRNQEALQVLKAINLYIINIKVMILACIPSINQPPSEEM